MYSEAETLCRKPLHNRVGSGFDLVSVKYPLSPSLLVFSSTNSITEPYDSFLIL